MSENNKVSMAEVQPKHRKFVREVANGRSPEEVVKELYLCLANCCGNRLYLQIAPYPVGVNDEIARNAP